jgi:hypothetical protein
MSGDESLMMSGYDMRHLQPPVLFITGVSGFHSFQEAE